jgi:hypothetical protein
LIAECGIILGKTPEEVARSASLPSVLLTLRVNRKREAAREFESTLSRYEAGRAKWCAKTHEAMQRRLKELSNFITGRKPPQQKPPSLARTLAELGIPSH